MSIDQLLTVMAVVTAVAAAARSTWSPCGLSMLSSITPFGERSRGNRYWVTASWFVAGATAGGATLGVVAVAGALVASAVGLSSHPVVVALIAAALAATGAAVDAGVFGEVLPVVRRQVDDRWLSRYRSWVYASGFGWQIGTGLLTYVMTCAVALTALLSALTGDALVAFAVATGFGTLRGTAVLLTSRADSPQSLRGLHRKLDRAAQPVRLAAISVQAVVAAVAIGYLWSPAPVGVAVLLAAGALARRRRAPTATARVAER